MALGRRSADTDTNTCLMVNFDFCVVVVVVVLACLSSSTLPWQLASFSQSHSGSATLVHIAADCLEENALFYSHAMRPSKAHDTDLQSHSKRHYSASGWPINRIADVVIPHVTCNVDGRVFTPSACHFDWALRAHESISVGV